MNQTAYGGMSLEYINRLLSTLPSYITVHFKLDNGMHFTAMTRDLPGEHRRFTTARGSEMFLPLNGALGITMIEIDPMNIKVTP